MNTLLSLTSAQLIKAAKLKDQIASLQKQLDGLLGSATSTKAPAAKKRKMSEAGKARIVAAQKARWEKVKAGKKATVASKIIAKITAKPAKKKFTMSAAAKAKISEAAKARWAKIKAAKKA